MEFGEYLKSKLNEKNIKIMDFVRKLEKSKTYIFDIFNGNNFPPHDLQFKMVVALDLSLEETVEFFDLAAKGRGELPADVVAFLIENAQVMGSIRKIMYSS